MSTLLKARTRLPPIRLIASSRCRSVARALQELRPRLPVDAVLMQDKYLSDDELLGQIATADEAAASYYASRVPGLVADPRTVAAGGPGIGDGAMLTD
eukprot:SAG22_NODE_639_length_8255_cov_13.659882_13_plen_98_part_00